MHLYIIIYWFIIFSEWSFLISFLFGFDCRGSVCLKRSTCCRIRESFRNSMTRSTVSRPISCEMLADSSPISCTLMPFLGRWSCFPFVVLILPVVGLRSDGNDIGPNFGYWDCISVEMVASGLFLLWTGSSVHKAERKWYNFVRPDIHSNTFPGTLRIHGAGKP